MRIDRRAGQMAELLKFFTEDFDAVSFAEVAPEPAVDAPVGPDPAVEAIRDAAYQDGLRDGMQQAAAGHEAAVARAAAGIEQRLQAAQYQAAEEAERAATAVARVVIQVLMKMLPAMCARYGADEVAEVARAVLPALHGEPQVVVAAHPDATAAVEAVLARLGAAWRERAVLAPDDGIQQGDVRITWRDGSAVRDTGELLRRVAAVFAGHGLIDAAAN